MHGSKYSTIVGLDLGKFNSVACLFDPADGSHRFQSLATTPRAMHDLLAGLTKAPGDAAKVLVVFETCEVCGWVHDVAAALGFAVAVANPCHEAWRWTKVKRKTDRDDALKLARMAHLGQLPTVHMPSPAMRQRRRLVHHRHALVRRRTAVKNQVRSVFAQQGLPLPPRGKAWTRAGVKELKAESRPLADCGEQDLWRGRLSVELALLDAVDAQLRVVEAKLEAIGASDDRVTLLTTVAGVGRCLAEAVVCHLDDVARFPSAAAVAGYAGGGGRVRGAGPQADGQRPDAAERADHAARPDAAARDAGRGRVDGLPAQRVGHGVRHPREPRGEGPQEGRGRRAGAEAAGDPLVDAAAQPPVARAGG